MSLFQLPDRTGLSRVVLGADPGKKGAIALLGDDDVLLAVEDMPDPNGGALTAALLSLIGEHEPYLPTIAWLEQAQPMPKQGLVTTFLYGRNFGALEAVPAALGIPFNLVTPAVWKKAFPGVTADKNTSREAAIRQWPMHADLFRLKKHDGRAEAALIALYGARQYPLGKSTL